MVTAPARLTGVVERMEQPGVHPVESSRALRTLARVNQCFGGTRVVLRHLERLCDGLPAPVRILDVGTGYADIPRAIVRWARRDGRPIEITALDRHAGTSALADRACADYPEIRLREGDALALPFPPGASTASWRPRFSITWRERNPSGLRELARVARRGILVHDLRRGVWPRAMTWTALRIVSRSPVIRHDGPLSIRRGFVPAELLEMARAAGWEAPRVVRLPFFRLVLMEHMS